MNSLFGIVAAPKIAKGALHLAGRAADAATKPFDMLLQAAVNDGDAADAASDAEEFNSLHERIARGLQQLLQSVGVAAGEEASLRTDGATGDVLVDGHQSSAAIQQALQSHPELLADLQRMAQYQSQLDGFVSPDHWELRTEVAAGQNAALLQWR